MKQKFLALLLSAAMVFTLPQAAMGAPFAGQGSEAVELQTEPENPEDPDENEMQPFLADESFIQAACGETVRLQVNRNDEGEPINEESVSYAWYVMGTDTIYNEEGEEEEVDTKELIEGAETAVLDFPFSGVGDSQRVVCEVSYLPDTIGNDQTEPIVLPVSFEIDYSYCPVSIDDETRVYEGEPGDSLQLRPTITVNSSNNSDDENGYVVDLTKAAYQWYQLAQDTYYQIPDATNAYLDVTVDEN
ncbi:MAG: hypothetical protein K6E18_11330, partial [Lachnospiraceae bacterium]|nr:hypothetical protein [Lachnospiraceae bacterium]